jgi:hypothetical protein
MDDDDDDDDVREFSAPEPTIPQRECKQMSFALVLNAEIDLLDTE